MVIDTATKTAIVKNLSDKLQKNYVFPEIAGEISKNLKNYLANGTYADIDDGESLAKLLTEHIQEINKDGHLRVKWHSEPLPKHESEHSLEENKENHEWLADLWGIGRLHNYGLHKVERLAGNVGYLDIRGFASPAKGGDTAIAAMNFLANTEALIIDLRQCSGGDPDMVALISSYLFGDERVHLHTMHYRKNNNEIITQSWTFPYVSGKKFADKKPIYVLTSKRTASGGEEFAYNLQTRQRAKIIGETTAGAAHPGTVFKIHNHFSAFIATGRPENPITKTNWEGTGVIPDIMVVQEDVFNTAYTLALKSIIDDIQRKSDKTLALLLNETQKTLKDMENSAK